MMAELNRKKSKPEVEPIHTRDKGKSQMKRGACEMSESLKA